MPVASIDGIEVNDVVKGEGTPLLMLAPGGFDSTVESWILDSVAVAAKLCMAA